MRIISGTFRGRRVNPPKGLSARPTTDRAKEGLFNYLAHRIELEGLSFLDLYAGTGNISFEFISRGAKGTAVERVRKATTFIEETAQNLNANQLTVHTMDVESFLNSQDSRYDLVFADPPYAMTDVLSLVNKVFQGGFINPGGLMILEHYDRVSTDHPNRIEQRKYGQSVFSIFQMPEDDRIKP